MYKHSTAKNIYEVFLLLVCNGTLGMENNATDFKLKSVCLCVCVFSLV